MIRPSYLINFAMSLASRFSDPVKSKTVQASLRPQASWMDKVQAFHLLYNAPIHDEPTEGLPQMDDDRLALRVSLIDEEFAELKKATTERDIVEIADALGDIIYVVCGMAIEAGIPLDAVVAEIHASNMTKMGADGNPVISDGTGEYPAGKVLKGPNYQKPNIRDVLGLPTPEDAPEAEETPTEES